MKADSPRFPVHGLSARDVLASCGIVVAVFLAYSNCFNYPFLFDGIPMGQGDAVAVFSAPLFGLHPPATHAVTYLYQRFESLVGLFFLASFCCLLRAVNASRPAGWLVGCYARFVLSLLTKAVANDLGHRSA